MPNLEEVEVKQDFSLLDQMINQFVATPEDQMLEVLCGYFYKIVK